MLSFTAALPALFGMYMRNLATGFAGFGPLFAKKNAFGSMVRLPSFAARATGVVTFELKLYVAGTRTCGTGVVSGELRKSVTWIVYFRGALALELSLAGGTVKTTRGFRPVKSSLKATRSPL